MLGKKVKNSLVQTLLIPGLVTMGPIRSGDSARRKPRGKLHPGMANGKGGPPLSKTDSNPNLPG